MSRRMTEAEARHLLKVDAAASRVDLKRAYRSMLKRWHPDRFVSDHAAGLAALEQTQLINEAYSVLIEREQRAMPWGAWSGRPVRTVRSERLLLRVIAAEESSVWEGALVFAAVWAVLAGAAVAVENLLL